MNNKKQGITTPFKPSTPIGERTTSSARSDWLVLTTLLLLSTVPFIAGAMRVVGLTSDQEITPENARFFADPVPVVVHIISAGLFSVLGAFQFAPGFRRRRLGWHRIAGRLLVPCGLAAGLSGLWMTQFYPLYPHLQNNLLYGFRILFGSTMVLSIVLGLAAILRRDIAGHRAWMMRGYAVGQGAGTQVVTFLLWFVILGTPNELAKEWLMGASWVINFAVAEWIIRSNRSRGRQKSTGEVRIERGMAHS